MSDKTSKIAEDILGRITGDLLNKRPPFRWALRRRVVVHGPPVGFLQKALAELAEQGDTIS